MEEMDKEVRHCFKAGSSAQCSCESLSSTPSLGWLGLITLQGIASHRVSHEQSTPCAIAIRGVLQKR